MKRFWWLLTMIATLVIIDQVTKAMIDTDFLLGESKVVIKDFFNITYVRNTGAFWGLGQGLSETYRQIFMLALPVLVVLFVCYLFLKSINGTFIQPFAYALVIAGAIGNLIDRFFLGYVVDFFDFHLGFIRWATFNVADACISVAMGLLIYDEIFNRKENSKKETSLQS